MQTIRTHYDNLRIDRDASPETIHAAYLSLSEQCHPDKNGNSMESQWVMKILEESYSVLSNPVAKQKYDAWIQQEESPEGRGEQASAGRELSAPTTGSVNFYDLDEETQKKLKQRATAARSDQHAIQLKGVFRNYIWTLLLLLWFCYLYIDTNYGRWSREMAYTYAATTFIVSVMLGWNLSRIYSWHFKPLKLWLITTPLYLMKFHFDRVFYWPISKISNIEATHRHKNGRYKETSLFITCEGKVKVFSIFPENAYSMWLAKFREYDQRLRNASKNRNLAYIIDNDDFLNARQNKIDKKKKAILSSTVLIYLLLPAIAMSLYGLGYQINRDKPPRPSFSASRPPAPITRPTFIRPVNAQNGSAWPSTASYVENYPQLHTDGLSSVTVDSSKNTSDVFVKLVSLAGEKPNAVRVFYIPASEEFKVEKIDAGHYDIRYMDLTNGGLMRSESFELQEVKTDEGVEFSNIKITLYKVQNGNMETYDLHESEF